MMRLIVPHRAIDCPYELIVPGVDWQRSNLNDDLHFSDGFARLQRVQVAEAVNTAWRALRLAL